LHLCTVQLGMKLATFGNDDALERLNNQFQQIEQRIITLQASLIYEKAAHNELKTRFELLQKHFDKQVNEIKETRQEAKILKTENKQLREKEVSLQEKLNNFKQLSIIVKNPKNANAITELNTKLDDYIRYIDETIALLRTI
jgi:chromosome segregation ATPase